MAAWWRRSLHYAGRACFGASFLLVRGVVRTPATAASLPPPSLPSLTLPTISLPSLRLPPISLPLVSVPPVSVPSVSVPPVSVPLVVGLLVGAYLVIQARADRRHPRLTEPPDGGDDAIGFT